MSSLKIPMKESKLTRDYPTFSLKIDETYQKKIRDLRTAGVDIANLMRPAVYERIDAALAHVGKKR